MADDPRFFYLDQGQPPYAIGIPDYLDLADKYQKKAVDFFDHKNLEQWVEKSLELPDLASEIHDLRKAHAANPEAGWKACRLILEALVPWRQWIRPEWVVRQVTRAIQFGEDPKPPMAQLPYELDKLEPEGNWLIASLLAIGATEVRKNGFTSPTNGAPAGRYLNAAIVDLVDRKLKADAANPKQSPLFEHLQKGLGALIGDENSVIRKAVDDVIKAYITANAKDIVSDLRVALLHALADELNREAPLPGLLKGIRHEVHETVKTDDDTRELISEMFVVAVPTIKPNADSELIAGVGDAIADNAVNNTLRANLDLRIERSAARLRAPLALNSDPLR